MQPRNNKLLIGITGGIASGKTLSANILEKFNLKVIYSDIIGHQVMEKEIIIRKLKDEFDGKIFSSGKINRKALGKIVFNDESQLKKLNKIVHPEIYKDLDELVEKTDQNKIFIEIPLLFENKLENRFDLIIDIFADPKTQIIRLKKRNNISKTEALKIIDKQMPNQIKSAKSQITIVNNHETTIKTIENKLRIVLDLLKLFKPRKKLRFQTQ